MRVLYVIGSLGPGGAETSLAEMAPALVDKGVDLHVLNLGPRRHMETTLLEAGAMVHSPEGLTSRLDKVRAVRSVAKQVQPDILHTTLYEADVAGRIAAGILRVPVSSSIVGDSYGPAHYAQHGAAKVHLARALDAATARAARRFHANSEALASTVPRRLGIPRDRVDVIPRGRSPERFRFATDRDRGLARGRLGLPTAASIVLAVGRLEPVKGLDQLLHAVSTVAVTHPDVVVLLAGKDGSASRSLRRLADAVPADVRFLGHRTDVPDLMTAADLLCLPSLREGFPGAVLEAMAVGCPVVVSDIASSRELLGEDHDGASYFPVGDAHALASAILNVLSDPVGARAGSAQARERFEQHFTVEAIADRMIGFFEKVAS